MSLDDRSSILSLTSESEGNFRDKSTGTSLRVRRFFKPPRVRSRTERDDERASDFELQRENPRNRGSKLRPLTELALSRPRCALITRDRSSRGETTATTRCRRSRRTISRDFPSRFVSRSSLSPPRFFSAAANFPRRDFGLHARASLRPLIRRISAETHFPYRPLRTPDDDDCRSRWGETGFPFSACAFPALDGVDLIR